MGVAPPCSFIAASVHLAVVATAQWNRKFIADLAIERPTLRKSYVVSIRRASAANQTGMLSDKFDVIRVTYSASFRDGSTRSYRLVGIAGGSLLLPIRSSNVRGSVVLSAAPRSFRLTRPEFIKLSLESVLYSLSIRLGQLVLFSEFLMGPVGRVIA